MVSRSTPPPASLLALVLAVALAAAGCGSGSSGGIVNCSNYGRVTRVSDPGGDVLTNGALSAGRPSIPARMAGIDLTRVDVARGHGRLCVVFQTRGLVRPPVILALALHLKSQPDSAGGVGIEIQWLAGRSPVVALSYPGSEARPDGGRVQAMVAVHGEAADLVIARRALPTSSPLLAETFAAFRWQAVSVYDGAYPGLPPYVQFADQAPNGAESVSYPDGRLVSCPTTRCP